MSSRGGTKKPSEYAVEKKQQEEHTAERVDELHFTLGSPILTVLRQRREGKLALGLNHDWLVQQGGGQRCLHTTSLFFSACLDYLFSSPPLRCGVPPSPSYSETELPQTESPQASLFSLQWLSTLCLLTFVSSESSLGFPSESVGKESVCNAGDPGFDPWVRKIPWRRKWQLTPVFFPGESPWTEEPGRLESVGLQSRTRLCD
ncbi:unnamed protein product [Rangifer tarandus platyrhynchus]|uniref:Uncharacterized protein n=1 Tax=Rangifer tarandus platyrhynchus TaxID=3082113 RepID=A0AC60A8B0_RANTA